MTLFQCTSDVFDEATALEPSYQPEYFVRRDGVFEEYVRALQPIAKGRSGQHIFVHGRSGTGKTATTRYILDQLRRDLKREAGRSLAVQRIAANAGSSSFKLLIKAVNRLRASRDADPISTTGHSTASVVDYLINELAALNAPLVLVVDDAHIISDPNVLFRELSRVRDRTGETHSDITVIAISNGASLLDSLKGDTRSTLRTRRLTFPPFSLEEITDILERRAEVGFKQEVKWHKIIDLCSSRCLGDGGDIRYAINLLRMAGENAEERIQESSSGDIEIGFQDVLDAEEALSTEWFGTTASQLTDRSQEALVGVIAAASFDQTPCRTSEVHRRLSNLSAHEGICEDYVRDQLDNLVSQDLVLRRSARGSGGECFEFELGASVYTGVAALDELDISWLDDDVVRQMVDRARSEGKISEQQHHELSNG